MVLDPDDEHDATSTTTALEWTTTKRARWWCGLQTKGSSTLTARAQLGSSTNYAFPLILGSCVLALLALARELS
jgi:hypothetical protein